MITTVEKQYSNGNDNMTNYYKDYNDDSNDNRQQEDKTG